MTVSTMFKSAIRVATSEKGFTKFSSAVALVVIMFMAGLLLNVRDINVVGQAGGSQQLKAKTGAAFLYEMYNPDLDDEKDNLLSVPAQASQVEVNGIEELMQYSFWSKSAGFCKVIRNLTIVPDFNMSAQLLLSKPPIPTLPVVVNFTFECKRLFKSSALGTGNWLSSF
jgi:hypothetical protein